ncbi:DUF2087 domain-containing protein, partial [Christensenellaceae bacterium OttesenSCG-928-L17]|nr:DUF2087 domain-containing protein [Christensenellaceae bacterium OttesenSCG-928-L17]
MNNNQAAAAVKPLNIAKFLDHAGRVAQIPSKSRTRRPVLQYLIAQFPENTEMTEREVNALLQRISIIDFMSARRLLVDEGYLCRTPNGASYWREKEIPMQWRWEKNM